jgi:hypothetical protein
VAGTTLADIWGYPNIAAGQLVRALPAAGYTLAVISDSVADVMTSGTGAWSVKISYLDTLYMPHQAVYNLNGQTAVTVATSIDGGGGGTVTNALRQNGMEVVSVGTGGSNAGNLYVCDSTNTYASGVPVTTTKVYDCALIGDNVDSSCMFTIPAGYYGSVVQFLPGINGVSGALALGKVHVGFTGGANGIFLGLDIGGVSSAAPVTILPAAQAILLPKSDIRMQGSCSATVELCCINILVIWPVA